MKKIDYIKHAWKMADDRIMDDFDKGPEEFKLTLGIIIGLTIALRIMDSNWTDNEIKAYMDILTF